MTRFSSHFPSFSVWKKARDRSSSYGKRIIRLHNRLPSATFSTLRKTTFRSLDLSKRKWNTLTPTQKIERNLSLEVRRRMLEGDSLLSASKVIEIRLNLVKRNLEKVLFKKHGRWFAKRSDKIERSLQIYERGDVKTIIVTNSKDASLIGSYFNAVRKYLKSGDTTLFKPFKKRIIIDDEGKKHRLETNAQKIRDIEDAKEDPEFFDIYSDE